MSRSSGGERQLELRQPLLDGRGVDLVAIRGGGPRHRDRVIELRQPVARVGQGRLALQHEVDLDDPGPLQHRFLALVEIRLPAGRSGLVRGADDFQQRHEPVVGAGADFDELLASTPRG